MGRQLKLIHYSNQFGGELAIGKRKAARPIATKRPMHLVLKSNHAKGKYSLLKKSNAVFIKTLLVSLSKTYFVQIMQMANSGNHIRLVVRAKDRKLFVAFRRVLSGKIAMHVTGGRKGNKLSEKFWDQTIFSRIVEFGRDLHRVCRYVYKNTMELPVYQRKHSDLSWLGP